MPDPFVRGSKFLRAQEQRHAELERTVGLPTPVPWDGSNLFLFMNSSSLKAEMSSAPTAPLGRLFMNLQDLMFRKFFLMTPPYFSRIYLFMASLSPFVLMPKLFLE